MANKELKKWRKEHGLSKKEMDERFKYAMKTVHGVDVEAGDHGWKDLSVDEWERLWTSALHFINSQIEPEPVVKENENVKAWREKYDISKKEMAGIFAIARDSLHLNDFQWRSSSPEELEDIISRTLEITGIPCLEENFYRWSKLLMQIPEEQIKHVINTAANKLHISTAIDSQHGEGWKHISVDEWQTLSAQVLLYEASAQDEERTESVNTAETSQVVEEAPKTHNDVPEESEPSGKKEKIGNMLSLKEINNIRREDEAGEEEYVNGYDYEDHDER